MHTPGQALKNPSRKTLFEEQVNAIEARQQRTRNTDHSLPRQSPNKAPRPGAAGAAVPPVMPSYASLVPEHPHTAFPRHTSIHHSIDIYKLQQQPLHPTGHQRLMARRATAQSVVIASTAEDLGFTSPTRLAYTAVISSPNRSIPINSILLLSLAYCFSGSVL